MVFGSIKYFKQLNINPLREFFAHLIGKKDPPKDEKLIEQLNRIEEKGAEYPLSLSSKKLSHLIADSYLSSDLQVRRHFIALLYRGEFEKPENEPSLPLLFALKKYAMEWKKQHPLIGQALLTAHELDQIKIAATYGLFSKLLLEDKHLRQQFFEWILQDENESLPFIEFPLTIERLIEAKLNGRISRLSHNPLRIEKHQTPNGLLKFLTLPFEGRAESILDPCATIQFKGSYVLKLRDVFEMFSKKEIEVGHLEFMHEGIINWNIHHLGYWDQEKQAIQRIDVNKKEWWRVLPNYRVMTRKQVVKRFHIDIGKSNWIAAAAATRGSPTLDFEDTHAFLELAVPLRRGLYALYDFGKLALKYPETTFDKLKMLTETVHATVAYPDENIFYTHRQHGLIPFVITPQQGHVLMGVIANDIQVSRDRNFVYQIESENCAKWVFHLLENVVKEMPDIFRMKLLDTEPRGPVKYLFNWIKKLPENWQVPVLSFLHLPLGAKRKIWIYEKNQLVAKSLATHSFFLTGEIFLPALLIVKVALSVKSLATHWLGRFRTIHKNYVKRLCYLAYVWQNSYSWTRSITLQQSVQRIRLS